MPDTGVLFLSLLCVVSGVAFVLFPNPLLRVSEALNKTLTVLDRRLMRHRYLVALLLFAVSYLLFNIALLVPELRS